MYRRAAGPPAHEAGGRVMRAGGYVGVSGRKFIQKYLNATIQVLAMP